MSKNLAEALSILSTLPDGLSYDFYLSKVEHLILQNGESRILIEAIEKKT